MRTKIFPNLLNVQNHMANEWFAGVNAIKVGKSYSTLNIHEPSVNHFFSSAARLPDICKVER